MLSVSNENNQIVYVNSINDDLIPFLKKINIIKNNNSQISKNISISDYSFKKIKGKIITRKNKNNIIILPNKLKINISSYSDFLDALYSFNNNNFILNVDNTIFVNPIIENNIITDKNNQTYSVKIKNNQLNNNQLNNLIFWLKNNSNNILLPLLEKFFTIANLTKSPNRFLAYTNLNSYLSLLKKNSSVFELNQENSLILNQIIEIYVDNVLDNFVILKSNDIYIQNNGDITVPYIFISTSTTKIQNETLPFFVVKYKSLNLFISFAILNNNNFIKNMKGAVNLMTLL